MLYIIVQLDWLSQQNRTDFSKPKINLCSPNLKKEFLMFLILMSNAIIIVP